MSTVCNLNSGELSWLATWLRVVLHGVCFDCLGVVLFCRRSIQSLVFMMIPAISCLQSVQLYWPRYLHHLQHQIQSLKPYVRLYATHHFSTWSSTGLVRFFRLWCHDLECFGSYASLGSGAIVKFWGELVRSCSLMVLSNTYFMVDA